MASTEFRAMDAHSAKLSIDSGVLRNSAVNSAIRIPYDWKCTECARLLLPLRLVLACWPSMGLSVVNTKRNSETKLHNSRRPRENKSDPESHNLACSASGGCCKRCKRGCRTSEANYLRNASWATETSKWASWNNSQGGWDMWLSFKTV